MASTTAPSTASTGRPTAVPARRSRSITQNRLVGVVTSTDHKVIGNLYLATSFGFFLFAGVLAMLIRLEAVLPGVAGRAES